MVSVGYGIAYPFGVIGVVLFMQLIPRFSNLGESGEGTGDGDNQTESEDAIDTKKFEVSNPQFDGKSLAQLDLHRITETTISRVRHKDTVSTAGPETILHLGDIVLAVGTRNELDKLELIFGPESQADMKTDDDILAREVYITEPRVIGKTLAELNLAKRFHIIISRVSREDLKLIPTGNLRLELGDLLRIVGNREDCQQFAQQVGRREKRVHETHIFPFSLGIVFGVILAYMPISLPGGLDFRLGLAGGPLLVGIVLGYYGGFGRLRLHTPYAVRFLLRELGLVFFLAGAGTAAGASFLSVFRDQGFTLIAAGMVITTIPLLFSYVLSKYYFQLDLASAMGAVCGSLTSTPGLGAVTKSLDSDEPAISYAAVYPLSLIFVTVASQLLCLFL